MIHTSAARGPARQIDGLLDLQRVERKVFSATYVTSILHAVTRAPTRILSKESLVVLLGAAPIEPPSSRIAERRMVNTLGLCSRRRDREADRGRMD